MTTKDHTCLSLKGENQSNFSNENGLQYSNLNLNGKQKCSSILETFQSNKSISTSPNLKNNDYACTKALDEYINRSKTCSSSWNKSCDNFGGGGNIYSNDSNIFGSTETSKKLNSNNPNSNKSSSSNNSTLSIHITAYENSLEAQNELKSTAAKNDGTDLSKIKINKVLKVLKTGSASMDAFEIPRQQTTEDTNEPEIMGFKASQKLQNPNQPPASSLDTTTFSILGQQKLKILVKVFIDRNQVNVIRNDFDEVISVKEILPNIFEKANLSSKEFVIQSITVFDRNVLAYVSVSDDYLLQPFDKFELYLTEKIQETEMLIQESGIQEPQKSIIDTSEIQNIKDLTELLSAKLDVKEGRINIVKFDEDFGANITVNDEEKFDPTNVYNSQVTKIMKFSGVVRPRLTVSSNNAIDQPNGSNSQTINAIVEATPNVDTLFSDLLGKLTSANFNEISTEIIKKFNWNDSGALSTIVELIFDAAVNGLNGVAIYANLCLKIHKKEQSVEGANFQRRFHYAFIRKCQKSFEEFAISECQKSENIDVKGKQRMIGIVKFISHLFGVGLLHYKIVENSILILLRNAENAKRNDCEIMLECAIEFMKEIEPFVGQITESINNFDGYVGYLEKFKGTVSNRIELMIAELMELRDKKCNGKKNEQNANQNGREYVPPAVQHPPPTSRPSIEQQQFGSTREAPAASSSNNGSQIFVNSQFPSVDSFSVHPQMAQGRQFNVQQQRPLGFTRGGAPAASLSNIRPQRFVPPPFPSVDSFPVHPQMAQNLNLYVPPAISHPFTTIEQQQQRFGSARGAPAASSSNIRPRRLVPSPYASNIPNAAETLIMINEFNKDLYATALKSQIQTLFQPYWNGTIGIDEIFKSLMELKNEVNNPILFVKQMFSYGCENCNPDEARERHTVSAMVAKCYYQDPGFKNALAPAFKEYCKVIVEHYYEYIATFVKTTFPEFVASILAAERSIPINEFFEGFKEFHAYESYLFARTLVEIGRIFKSRNQTHIGNRLRCIFTACVRDDRYYGSEEMQQIYAKHPIDYDKNYKNLKELLGFFN